MGVLHTLLLLLGFTHADASDCYEFRSGSFLRSMANTKDLILQHQESSKKQLKEEVQAKGKLPHIQMHWRYRLCWGLVSSQQTPGSALALEAESEVSLLPYRDNRL